MLLAPQPEAPPRSGLVCEQLVWWWDDTPRDAALQMALDEALLRTVPIPTLRFYRWAGAAVTFGYFVPFEEADRVAGGRDLVRRWTGGGIVEHGDDTTYSLVFPAGGCSPRCGVKGLYRAVHAALRLALGGDPSLSLHAEGISKGGLCFSQSVAGDLVGTDGKLAGAAQRRTRAGVLHQGSVARPRDRALARAFAVALAEQATEIHAPGPDLIGLAVRLSRERYATESWNRRF